MTAIQNLAEASVDDINAIASFLSREEARSLGDLEPIDCIVLCGSAILNCAESVFRALQVTPFLASTLVICGGIGHSTRFLNETLARHELYHDITNEYEGQSESRLLYQVFARHFDAAKVEAAGCRVLIEDQSTNCGANAVESKNILSKYSIQPKRMVIVQDPTMSLRTFASFEKAYESDESPPRFYTFPSFTPQVAKQGGQLVYNIPGVDITGIWDLQRFYDLLLGEIPRLQDDEAGYGPNGKGFIAHVEVPRAIEGAWTRLSKVITAARTQV